MKWYEGDFAYFNPNGAGNDPPLLVQLIKQDDFDPSVWKVKSIDYLHRSHWGGWNLGRYDEAEQTFYTTDDLIGPAESYCNIEIDISEFL